MSRRRSLCPPYIKHEPHASVQDAALDRERKKGDAVVSLVRRRDWSSITTTKRRRCWVVQTGRRF